MCFRTHELDGAIIGVKIDNGATLWYIRCVDCVGQGEERMPPLPPNAADTACRRFETDVSAVARWEAKLGAVTVRGFVSVATQWPFESSSSGP